MNNISASVYREAEDMWLVRPTSPSYGSHTQDVLLVVAALRVHPPLVRTVLEDGTHKHQHRTMEKLRPFICVCVCLI